MIYNESSLGTRKFYFSPEIIDNSSVLVTIVYCIDKEFALPKAQFQKPIGKELICTLDKSTKFYARRPEYIFDTSSTEHLQEIINAVYAFYQQAAPNQLVHNANYYEGSVFIGTSQNGCYPNYNIHLVQDGDYEFIEDKILICS